MPTSLHEDYRCSCRIPVPKVFRTPEQVEKGERGDDWGVCVTCNNVFDERLYEMMCRKHIKNWNFESVGDYIANFDPHYRELMGLAPLAAEQ